MLCRTHERLVEADPRVEPSVYVFAVARASADRMLDVEFSYQSHVREHPEVSKSLNIRVGTLLSDSVHERMCRLHV